MVAETDCSLWCVDSCKSYLSAKCPSNPMTNSWHCETYEYSQTQTKHRRRKKTKQNTRPRNSPQRAGTCWYGYGWVQLPYITISTTAALSRCLHPCSRSHSTMASSPPCSSSPATGLFLASRWCQCWGVCSARGLCAAPRLQSCRPRSCASASSHHHVPRDIPHISALSERPQFERGERGCLTCYL